MEAADSPIDFVQARLQNLRSRLGPELIEAFDALLNRLDMASVDEDRLLHPLGQPLVQLPVWAARRCERVTGSLLPSAAVDDMVEAAIVGYLHVRVQDDFVDEGIGDASHAMFLSDVFLVRHQSLVARTIGGNNDFWDYFEGVAFTYCDAMLLEERLHRPYETYRAEDFDRILGRSRPLVLPPAALFARADCFDDVSALGALVHRVTRASQLVDDLLDCLHDLDHGNHTWVVRRIGGAEGRATAAKRLLNGALDEVLAEALDDMDRAHAIADSLQMDEAAIWAKQRADAIRLLPGELIGRLLQPTKTVGHPTVDSSPKE